MIWSVVRDRASSASAPSLSFFVFLVLATVLAAVAVVTDSAVLVVGAMVVGPEFGAIAALCSGIVLGEREVVLRSAFLLVAGFAVAILVVAVLAWLAAMTGLLQEPPPGQTHPMTEFIWRPNRWSVVVALAAGIAGVLAMATDKSSAMVGVFISVTTVPAAGALALGLATTDGESISGSLAQLFINVAGLLVAGVATMGALRLSWLYLQRSDLVFVRRARGRLRASRHRRLRRDRVHRLS